MNKPQYHVASFSGGKDSTAMVLHMIELGDPLDEVMFCDTTMEFPGMIRHVEKVRKVIEAAGIKFTELRAPHDFEYYLTTHEVEGRKPGSAFYGVPGYGWAGHKSRWCTKTLKVGIMERHLRELQEDFEVIQYIGIAADEDYRMERKGNQDPSHRHPLRDWGWTEAAAMQYCRDRGYDWEGLYDIFDRVSCWCCPLKNYDELRRTRKLFPDLWEKLLDLDSRQAKKFQHGYSVADFDLRFRLEDALEAAGHRINSLSFFVDLKRLLAGEVTIDEILQERNI